MAGCAPAVAMGFLACLKYLIAVILALNVVLHATLLAHIVFYRASSALPVQVIPFEIVSAASAENTSAPELTVRLVTVAIPSHWLLSIATLSSVSS